VIAEDFTHLCNPQKGYHHHLKKLLAKANELIERHPNKDIDLDATRFTIISDLSTQIFKLLTDKELIDDICEAKETKESLTTAVARVTQILSTFKSTPVSDQSSPPSD